MEPKVIVIGGGICGLLTAYFINQKGFKVQVIEQKSGVGLGASFANGSQISFSHINPIYLHDKTKLSFFANSYKYDNKIKKNDTVKTLLEMQKEAKHHSSSHLKSLANLSSISLATLNEIIKDEDIAKYIKPCGIIHLFESESEMKEEKIRAKSYNMPFQVLSDSELKEKEPNLEYFNTDFKGGVFYPEDKTSNCHEICKILEVKLKEKGVEFIFNSKVKKLNTLGDRITSITLEDNTELKADNFICVNGTLIPNLVKDLELNYPIFPVRGYSYTFNMEGSNYAPFTGLIDRKRKMVYSLYKNYLRVAGFFDAGVENPSDINLRLEDFKETIFETFPLLRRNKIAHKWTENRPFTPSCVPIIGKSDLFNNLFINGGHGALGFTLSFGSAKIISELI